MLQVIAAKKERKKDSRKRRKYKKYYKLLAVRIDIVVFQENNNFFNAQCSIVPFMSTEGIIYQMKTCLQFVIVIFPDHTHFLFLTKCLALS